MERFRVLIADDHRVVRRGLRAIFETAPEFKVVGEAEDGDDAVRQAADLRPDLILMDLKMPVRDGISATREIKARHPDTEVILLAGEEEGGNILDAIRAGATGYLSKDSLPEDVLRAARAARYGGIFLDPVETRKLFNGLSWEASAASYTCLQPELLGDLTGREIEVFRLILTNLKNREIAARLSISETTVKTHVGNILRKLDLSGRSEALLYGARRGWLLKEG